MKIVMHTKGIRMVNGRRSLFEWCRAHSPLLTLRIVIVLRVGSGVKSGTEWVILKLCIRCRLLSSSSYQIVPSYRENSGELPSKGSLQDSQLTLTGCKHCD